MLHPTIAVLARDAPVSEERERRAHRRPTAASRTPPPRVQRSERSPPRIALEVPPARSGRSPNTSSPAGLHVGCQIDSSPSRPATDPLVRERRRPAARSATNSSHPSHGIHGRSHARKQAAACRRGDSRVGVEVATTGDHARFGRSVDGTATSSLHVIGDAARSLVPLAHADPAGTVRGETAVGEPMRPSCLRRDRDRLAASGCVPVEPTSASSE